MSAYVGGDSSAFDELSHRYAGMVIAFMRKGYVAQTDAEDLTQQVFLQLHRARRDFKPGALLRPWLMTIARNVKHDHWRRVLRRPLPQTLLEDPVGRPLAMEDTGELRDALERAVETLPESMRTVIRAFWFEDKSHTEIAASLGISRGAVKVRAHRAYAKLRQVLSDSGEMGNRDAGSDVEDS